MTNGFKDRGPTFRRSGKVKGWLPAVAPPHDDLVQSQASYLVR